MNDIDFIIKYLVTILIITILLLLLLLSYKQCFCLKKKSDFEVIHPASIIIY